MNASYTSIKNRKKKKGKLERFRNFHKVVSQARVSLSVNCIFCRLEFCPSAVILCDLSGNPISDGSAE